MGLFKKGRYWYVAVRKNGTNVVKSTGTTNKKLAQEILDKIVTDITRGQWFKDEEAKKHKFSDMWVRYKERYEKSRDKYSILHLLPIFGDKPLYEIDTSMIEDYVVKRLESEDTPTESTVYKEYALARRMFNVARKTWKWVQGNPFADFEHRDFLNPDNPRDRWLTIEEEQRLLSMADATEWLHDVCLFALHTGCRRGEILSAHWNSIDIFRKTITVQVSKRKKKDKPKLKTIPMSDALYQMLLRRQRVQHITGVLFPITADSLRHYFVELVKKAELKNVRFHDLRRTFGTRLAQAGIDLFTIKNLLGHESIVTTERYYAHHCPESLRDSVKVLDAVTKHKPDELVIKG